MSDATADELGRLARRVRDLEADNQRLRARCGALERRDQAWLSQFVAALRLHQSLRRQDVVTALGEILATLLGCEEGALYERHADELRPTAAFGIELGRVDPVRIGDGVIGRAAADGRVWLAADQAEGGVAACVPLLLDGRVTGALALFRLLPQAAELDSEQRQLLELLSTHAAVAVEASAAPRRTE